MRVAVLAHGKFPDRAKTAVGVLRYGDQVPVAVLDRDRAGDRVGDHVPDLADGRGAADRTGTGDEPASAAAEPTSTAEAASTADEAPSPAEVPIVASMDEVPACDALVIGIAPIGGGFDESWRTDVVTALERGCDVIAGLHYSLAGDEEFAALADEHDCDLRDVREPPEDLTVAEGIAGDLDAHVIGTVGTDCSTGKLTTTLELVDALRDAGYDAAAVPTGQTGILIEGWGIAVDRAIADYAAGAAERLVTTAAVERDHDVLVVEGQGSIVHPAYSGVTCGLLHGAMPDALVLCHEHGREAIHGYERFAFPPAGDLAARYESVAAPVHETSVVAGALNTAALPDDKAAREALERYADEIGGPTTDPVRFDAAELVEAVAP